MDGADAEELTFEPHLLGLQLSLLHGETEAVSSAAMSPWQGRSPATVWVLYISPANRPQTLQRTPW